MGEYEIRPLTSGTWPAFEALCARNNGGGMGGCWCLQFHYATSPVRRAAIDAVQAPGTDRAEARREHKKQLVQQDRAHAALVFDGDLVVGWCQYGSPAELPGITHRKEVELPERPVSDYRLGCFLVDRRHRRRGVAEAALAGVLDLIAQAGGGIVEAYPFDTTDRTVSGSFLYNGTRDMCERAGFTYERPKGKNHCIMTKVVDPA
jgi:ribosomal protein S18 acetylase RimI-like enzyme